MVGQAVANWEVQPQVVIPEVRPFKMRPLTFGLPHSFAVVVIWATLMLVFYFEYWITGAVFFGFFYTLGRAGLRFDPFFWECCLRLPSYPRVLAP